MVKRREIPEIVQWSDVAASYHTGSLILGNGSSMAVHPGFSYRSLFESARTAGELNPAVLDVFKYLETRDFELVLNLLWHTHHVNRSLGISEALTDAAYENVREGLARAVRRNHAAYEEVESLLPAIASFMHRFHTVVSLNYDLLVYWAMLEGNRERGNWFKDCFVHGEFCRDWERLREPYGAEGTTLVFYPHGNLALATRLTGSEFKIHRDGDFQPLLDSIVTRWSEDDIVPLFVSEGDRKQKEDAIRRSEYLSIVYNTVLTSLGPSAVVVGWSMSHMDNHILRQVGKSGIRRVAVSIFEGGRNADEIEAELFCLDRKLKRFMSADAEWVFFDAASSGFWVNP